MHFDFRLPIVFGFNCELLINAYWAFAKLIFTLTVGCGKFREAISERFFCWFIRSIERTTKMSSTISYAKTPPDDNGDENEILGLSLRTQIDNRDISIDRYRTNIKRTNLRMHCNFLRFNASTRWFSFLKLQRYVTSRNEIPLSITRNR